MGQVIEIHSRAGMLADEARVAHEMLDILGIETESDGEILTVAGRIAALTIRMAELADAEAARESANA